MISWLGATCCACLSLAAAAADRLASSPPLPAGLVAAAADNAVHLVLGGLSWAAVLLVESGASLPAAAIAKLGSGRAAAEVLLCAAVASAVDLDHFIEARSFKLQDAVNLNRRPFLHLSLIPAVILASCFAARSLFDLSTAAERLGLLTFVAMVSHHLRDSWRRGLWIFIWPISGKRISVPVSYVGYLSCLAVLPLLAGLYSKFRGLLFDAKILSRLRSIVV